MNTSIQERAAQLRAREMRTVADGLRQRAAGLIETADRLEADAQRRERIVYVVPVDPADETNCEACQ